MGAFLRVRFCGVVSVGQAVRSIPDLENYRQTSDYSDIGSVLGAALAGRDLGLGRVMLFIGDGSLCVSSLVY